MTRRVPRTITGPIRVERHDCDNGFIIYELWDHGSKTYHQVCSVSEHTCANAKAEADFIALAMNSTLGALMLIDSAEKGKLA